MTGRPIDLAEVVALGLTGPLEEPLEAQATAVSRPARPESGLTQRVRVTLEGDDGPTVYDVTLDARDRRAYALLADRYQLPRFDLDAEGTIDVLRLEVLTVFSAWHALHHRLGTFPGDWPAFNRVALDVAPIPGEELSAHPPGPGGG